jgi:hypothetical protein
MQQADTGFDATNVMTARLPLSDKRYPDPVQLDTYLRQIIGNLQSLPGVRDVASASALPLQGWGYGMPFQIAREMFRFYAQHRLDDLIEANRVTRLSVLTQVSHTPPDPRVAKRFASTSFASISTTIAPGAGHTMIHWLSPNLPKHSVHASESTKGRLSPGEIASMGHSQIHAPQVRQASVIRTAIVHRSGGSHFRRYSVILTKSSAASVTI